MWILSMGQKELVKVPGPYGATQTQLSLRALHVLAVREEDNLGSKDIESWFLCLFWGEI